MPARMPIAVNQLNIISTNTKKASIDLTYLLKIKMYQNHSRLMLLLLWVLSFSCSLGNSFGTLSTHTSSFAKRSINSSTSTATTTTSSNLLRYRGGSNEPIVSENGSYTDNQVPSSTGLSVATDDLSEVTTSSNDESTNAVNAVSSAMGPNASPPGFLRKLLPTLPWHKLPNYLTYARCLAIPALIVQFYTSHHVDKNIHSALIFALASITDYLDGYLARRWDICSPFGAFLDPVADKLMVSTALILLTGKYGYTVAIPSAIILAREIAVSALREWMASRGKRDSVKVGFQGKVKTAATMVALTIVMSVPDAVGTAWNLNQMFCTKGSWDCIMSLGMSLLFLSSVVTVTSGSVYFKAAAPVLMGKE